MSINVALCFLHEFILEKCRAVLVEDWKSYGVTIGLSGSTITPMDLLMVKYTEDTWTAREGAILQAEDKMRLFIVLLAGYRFGLASEIVQGDYQLVVLGKINQVARNEPFNLDDD